MISTAKRPVPLRHHLWAGKELHTIVDEQSRFLSEGSVVLPSMSGQAFLLQIFYKSSAMSDTKPQTRLSGGNRRRSEKLQAYQSCKELVVLLEEAVEARLRPSLLFRLEAHRSQTSVRGDLLGPYHTARRLMAALECLIRTCGFTLYSTSGKRNFCRSSSSRSAKSDARRMQPASAVRISAQPAKRAKSTSQWRKLLLD